MQIDQRIYNGNRAKEVIENEAFIAAFELIKDEVITQWQQSPARDTEGREKLWLMLQMASKLESTLKTTMETGQLAQLELTHQQSLAKRLKDAIYNDWIWCYQALLSWYASNPDQIKET